MEGEANQVNDKYHVGCGVVVESFLGQDAYLFKKIFHRFRLMRFYLSFVSQL